MSLDRQLTAPDHPAASPPAAWYPDPVRGSGWRWWNGSAWTTFTEASTGSVAETARPRRPRWISWPVAICAPIVAIGIAILAVVDPVAVAAGLVPLAIVLPAVSWFDRVEPEPRASRVHAVLWGASVAIIGALVINTAVALIAGDVTAMVLSAPIVEEALKGLGVVWAVRRREIDGLTDGIVYSAWVALGFAVVEDMTYFAQASVEGALLPVFVLRALLTPFVHPLFTFWIGLAVGLAVKRGRPIWPGALWGYALAVLTHMAWNGSLAIGEITTEVDEDVATTVLLVAAGLFVILFGAVVVAVIVMRRREQRRFEAGAPAVVLRYPIAPDEAAMFSSWRAVLTARRQFPRSHRRHFDAVHAAIARLVVLQQRSGPVDPDAELVLSTQLCDARDALRDRR